MIVAQLLVNGLALGAAYALVALGFVLVVNATGAVNFAQGDLVVAGGLLAVSLFGALGLPGVVLLPLVMGAMAALGLLIARLAYVPLRHRPPAAVFISTIAVGLMLENAANGLFGAAPRAGPALFGAGFISLSGLRVPRQSIAIIAVAAVLFAGLHLLLAHTQLGRKLRATAADAEMARAVGVNVGAMIALSFALAASLAGAAGLLLSNQYFVAPGDGANLMLKAYVAATLGGWGRVWGAAVGAVLIAVFELLVSAWLSQAVAATLLYVTVLAVLAVRPQGLFGEAAGRRA